MASNAPPYPTDSKEAESMQQAPTAPPLGPPSPPSAPSMEPPPMGPPPTYTEAMSSPMPYPPIPPPVSSKSTPYPTSTETAMPLPIPSTAPYPIDDNSIIQPMTQIHPTTMPVPVHDAQANYSQHQPMGFDSFNNSPHMNQRDYDQQSPIVNQPGVYRDDYVHPKTTYVVLQDDRNRRRNDDDECDCTDWMLCCWCCVETCRCMLLILECAAACSK